MNEQYGNSGYNQLDAGADRYNNYAQGRYDDRMSSACSCSCPCASPVANTPQPV
jgi:hypothetical protein